MATQTRPPRIDYTTDDRADERLSPAEQAKFDQVQAGLGESELSDREKAAIAGLESQFGDSEEDIDGRRVDAASEAADRQESSAPQDNGFYQPAGGKSSGRKQPLTLKGVLKKGGPIGIVSILLGGFTFTNIFMSGPLLMLSHITENLIDKNDSSAVAQDIRLPRILRRILTGRDYKSQLGRKGGRISNKGLRRLAKKGIVPVNADGSAFDTSGKKLYPDKQPTHYSVKELNGGKPMKREDLVKELLKKGNERHANRAFGRRGAFKLRVKMWMGKHLKVNFLEKLGLKKDGGIARRAFGKFKGNKGERFKAFREKLPKFDTEKPIKRVREFANKHSNKAKKAGVIYTVIVVSCMASKIPKMVAIGVAAVQFVQIVYLVWDLILTPHSKAKADGFGSGFTGDDADAIGTALTEKGITQGSKNTRGSALDSSMMLFAMGMLTHKQTVSSYAPGYSFFTNDAFKKYNQVMDAGVEATCDAISSDYAMWGTMAVEGGIALLTGGASAVISWAGKEAAIFAFNKILERVIGEVFTSLLQKYAPNDMLPKAKYKDLGDALGVSAMAFFSSGSMAQALPTLKTNQLAEFNQIKIANEEFQKRMDLASLSPFDTSSKYTFLGSIVHNMGNMMLANGTYDRSIASTFSNILRLPSFALSFSSTAHAKGMYSEDYCGYAKAFGQGGSVIPAINAAGLPCTGITRAQADMSSEEAVAIAEEEGWLDENVEVKEGATLQDLMDSKYIKEDTPLRDFVEACTDASSGDYWVNAGGCTMPNGGTSDGLDQRTSITGVDSSGKEVTYTTAEEQGVDSPATVKTTDNRKMAAIPVLLMDFMFAQSLNGEDDDNSTSSSSSSLDEEPTISSAPYSETSSSSTVLADYPFLGLLTNSEPSVSNTEETTEDTLELASANYSILPVEQTVLYNAICAGHDWTTRMSRSTASTNLIRGYSIS